MKILLLLMFPMVVFGAELDQNVDAPSLDREISIWQLLIPIAVPLIIAGLKALIPKLPKKLTPFLAPIIGALIDVLLNLADLGSGVGAVGAFLGSAGVGVREMVDQVKKTPGKAIPGS